MARARALPPAKGDSELAGDGKGGGDPDLADGLRGGVVVGAIAGDVEGLIEGLNTVGGPLGTLNSGGLKAPCTKASGAMRGSAATDPLGRMSAGGGRDAVRPAACASLAAAASSAVGGGAP